MSEHPIEELALDSEGHFGIADSEWVREHKTVLLIVEMQNFGLHEDYSILPDHDFSQGQSTPEQYFRRVREVVIPNTQKLLK